MRKINILMFLLLLSSQLWATKSMSTDTKDLTPPTCATPTNLSPAEITKTGATINWTGDAAQYIIEYKTSTASTWIADTANANNFILDGLTVSSDYDVRIKAICDIDSSSIYSDTIHFTTLEPTCAIPTALASTNIKRKNATINWTGDAAQYILEYKRDTASKWILDTTDVTTNILKNLTPSSIYDVRIKAICSVDSSSIYSDTFQFTTLSITCATPSAIATTNITINSAKIKWTSDASKYIFEYKRDTASKWIAATIDSMKYELKGLTASSAYDVRIKAVCTADSSSIYGDTLHFTTLTPTCATPSALTSANITNRSASINWTGDASQYVIECKRDTASKWVAVSVNKANYELLGLTASSAYDVRVKAVCSSDSSSIYSDTIHFTTTIPTCAIPTAISTSEITKNSASIYWTSDAVEYVFEYKIDTSSKWTSETISNMTYSITDSIAYSIYGLTASTNYDVRIKAICSQDSLSTYGNTLHFTTLEPTCATPSALTSTDITTNNATINWIGDATQYVFEYKRDTATKWIADTIETATYALKGLTATSNYDVRIKAVCSLDSLSIYSETLHFTTSAPTCDAPTNFVATGITYQGAVFNWTGNAPKYVLAIKLQENETWVSDTIPENTVDLTDINLPQNTAFDARVKALCSNGLSSDWSETIQFTTLINTCIAPTDITVFALGSDSATIMWNGSAAVGYYIDFVDENGKITEGPSSETTSVTLKDLTPNTKYRIALLSVCSYDPETETETMSEYSELLEFTTTAKSNSIEDNNELNLNVFNSNNQINIVNNSNVKINEVVVLNMMGQEVAHYNVNKAGNVVIEANLPEANYIVKVISNKNIGSYKMFIK